MLIKKAGLKAMNGYPQGLAPGDVLGGRYRVIRGLGSGGMSAVLLAEDLKLQGKYWAIKESWAGWPGEAGEIPAEEVMRRRIVKAEAAIMSRLSHPNLPDIVDAMAPDERGFLYLVMDYIEGDTLQQRFERQGRRVGEEEVAEWARQLCGLLDYLHSLRPEPLIHRDLKPSNLMIDGNGRLRLIDFGTARSFKPQQSADTVCLGTIGFAAPEQLEGRQSDAHTDLYGLGALMYYLLSGGRYYRPGPEAEAALPAGLAPLVLALLRARPAERFASAREAGAALHRWLAERRPALPAAAAAPQGAAAWAPPLVVAVGALYPGAGATFAALAIARLLHDLGVPHALIEPPTPRTELQALLFAEKNAPAAYRCYNAPGEGGFRPHERPWTDGHTLWLPAEDPAPAGGAPNPAGEAFDAAAWLKLFHAVRRPVLIADIGSQWEHPAVRELLETATDVVCTADPLVYKLELPAARRCLRQLDDWASPGRRVHGFANRCPEGSEEWLRVLPLKPVCRLPVVDFAAVAGAAWRGQLPHEAPAVRTALRRAMTPWLSSWLPEGLTAPTGRGLWHPQARFGGGWLQKLFF
ncbi:MULTISPECIES: serine/threonine protein kinase [Paenibacillus]|uniref:serine/threonine protein kinase n=1 Tax=Paenibacillus TaxID=44249 RepID=UPI0022B8A32E|nr:serine/threonine-protein kinase [Paenibacillus caseinilyticus]MCZ8523494.1 serine/threonine-protein kinase [Paenibacillus caseinilyticus]